MVVIIHGLGTHSGLFSNVVNYLLPQNYAIYAFDLRGHGRSPGQRGYINSWDEYRGDLDAFLTLIKQQNSGCSCFLLGNSLGGIVALDYVLSFPNRIQGVIAIGVPLGRVGVSPLKIMIGKLLSRVCPRFSLDTGIELEAATRNQEILAEYAQDTLRHTQSTARLATEFLATVEWIKAHTPELKVPLLLLHGEKDRVCLPQGTRLFFEKVTCPDKEFKEYPGAYHELHNELNYQEVMADLSSWLERHR
jgi:alpha-beta hydrolase superfamily lysophospholipase